MSYFLAFLLLLGLAIAVRYVGNRLTPLAMPSGKIKTAVVGMAGGLVGSLVGGLVFGFVPPVVGINLLGAVLGTALFILLRGLAPFIKIMIGRT